MLVDAIPHCMAHGGDRGSGPTACSGIAAMTRRPFGVGCARGTMSRGSLCAAKHGNGLRRWRWVVERTFAWLNQSAASASGMTSGRTSEAFLSLGCALICGQSLRKTWRTV